MRRFQLLNHLLALAAILIAFIAAHDYDLFVSGSAVPTNHVRFLNSRGILARKRLYMPEAENNVLQQGKQMLTVDNSISGYATDTDHETPFIRTFEATGSAHDERLTDLVDELIGNLYDILPRGQRMRSFARSELEPIQHERLRSQLGKSSKNSDLVPSFLDMAFVAKSMDNQLTAPQQAAALLAEPKSLSETKTPVVQMNLPSQTAPDTREYTERELFERHGDDKLHTRRSADTNNERQKNPGNYYDESMDQVMQQIQEWNQLNSKRVENSRWNQLRGMWG